MISSERGNEKRRRMINGERGMEKKKIRCPFSFLRVPII
jgi:hypothetical protein